MNQELCPKIEKCPLFTGVLLKRKGSEESYKNLYCKAGKEKWSVCKRYLTSEKVGKCPDWVLPNCSKSLEEIVAKMNEKEQQVH